MFNSCMKRKDIFCLIRLLFLGWMVTTSDSLLAQSILSTPFRLVNSSDDEQAPVISPDGRTMFLTIANRSQNIGGRKDTGDIWISVWANGEWSAPVHGGSQINNEAYNSVVGFSKDGDRIFLSGHYSKNGNVTTQGFSFSDKGEYGWGFPENIVVPYFRNKADKLNGAITPDQSIFIFSAE